MKTVEHGIVLKRINYSDNSLIVSLLTDEGVKRYIFPGAKKKSGQILQPLSLIEVTAFKRPESDLPRITAVEVSSVLHQIPFHPIKGGIAFFLAEILLTVFSEGDVGETTYDFLTREVQFVDLEIHLANYPAWFLVRLTKELGINPEVQAKTVTYLDLEEGVLCSHKPSQHIYITGSSAQYIADFIQMDKEAALSLTIPKNERKQLMQDILRYYQFQLDKFKVPKSLEILEIVFG
jgi:DNA repair protein RecO (recombination protein O)